MRRSRYHQPIPFLVGRDHERKRMWCIFKEVVILGLLASNDIFRFLPNLNHSIAESVDLFQCFRLRRLNQHASGYGPGARRRVEAVVLDVPVSGSNTDATGHIPATASRNPLPLTPQPCRTLQGRSAARVQHARSGS